MLRGCRRVSGALCELHDSAAACFARHYAAALRVHAFMPNRRPHAFALAFKQAENALRRSGYDHESFWAPLVLYGLG